MCTIEWSPRKKSTFQLIIRATQYCKVAKFSHVWTKVLSEKIGEGAPSPIFFEESGKKCHSLYRGLRYTKVRYIEVPLHKYVLVLVQN